MIEAVRQEIEHARAEESSLDAEQARRFVEAAFNPSFMLYRDHGPDRLLAAAQVYATLSTR